MTCKHFDWLKTYVSCGTGLPKKPCKCGLRFHSVETRRSVDFDGAWNIQVKLGGSYEGSLAVAEFRLAYFLDWEGVAEVRP